MTQKLMGNQLHSDQKMTCQILHEDLGERKVCVKFIPHSVTNVRNEHEITSYKNLIQNCETNPHFFICIITGD